ncbi:MAG: 4-phosphoerythronate dehydrogenase PdxB [Planctomycetota bacterium]|jgi:erythronate-4-phosphate dehydrogenase
MKIIADENIPFVRECFVSIGEVKVFTGRDITADSVADADVLLVRSVTKVDEQLLKGSKVRFVATATIGFDHIDVDYLNRKDIGFASAPGSNANSVAEYILAALLEIAEEKKVKLADKSIGIVGVGNVGGIVERKCRVLGMKIVLNDPPLCRQTGDSKYRPLKEVFECDFITLHTPLSFEGIDKTYHLGNRDFFGSLKQGCVFLNSSRGGVVDMTALKEAIKAGKLGAVVLDVWENEPNIDAQLLDIVDIGTSHIAGYSFDGKVAGMIMIYRAACEYFGLNTEFNEQSFLPEPQVPQLDVTLDGNEQEVIRDTVRKIYNIRSDDRKLQGFSKEPAEKRAAFFSRLRKEYHIRREFQNTMINLKVNNQSLSDKLAGIGFKV